MLKSILGYAVSIVLTLLFTSYYLIAQCSFDELLDHLISDLNPEVQNIIESNNQKILEQLYPMGGAEFSLPFEPPFNIPVVFHIMHYPGDSEGIGTNIHDDIINDAINQLNEDFNGMSGGFNTNIQFCLAQRDPDGLATTGINRIAVMDSDVPNFSTSGIITLDETNPNEIQLKSLSIWPAEEYYNIWIVPDISSGALGYAYFPDTVSPQVDGAVVEYDQVGTAFHILSHEVGHSFFVYHTFEGDKENGLFSCPTDIPCNSDPVDDNIEVCNRNIGDMCEDTDAHIRAFFNCLGGLNSCVPNGTLDELDENFMNYSAQLCQQRFTEDQSDRMCAAISLFRRDLLLGVNCLPLCPSADASFTGPSFGTVGIEIKLHILA